MQRRKKNLIIHNVHNYKKYINNERADFFHKNRSILIGKYCNISMLKLSRVYMSDL